jgi:hypothetical protein
MAVMAGTGVMAATADAEAVMPPCTDRATMAIRPTGAATMGVAGGTEAEATMEEAGAGSDLSGRARSLRVPNYTSGGAPTNVEHFIHW